jgi:hypothetical protein
MSVVVNTPSASAGRLAATQSARDTNTANHERKTTAASTVVAVSSGSVSPRTSASLSALSESTASESENSFPGEPSSEAGRQADAEAALKALEQASTVAKSSANADAEAKLQQLLKMYEKLLVLGDVKAMAALGKEIATTARDLGESMAQPGGTATTSDSAAQAGGSQIATGGTGSIDAGAPNSFAPAPTDPQAATDTPALTGTTASFTAPGSADQKSEAPPVANNPPVESGTDPEAEALLNLAKAVLSAIKHRLEAEQQQPKEQPRATEARTPHEMVL